MYKQLKLNLARNSLRYIIRTYQIKTMYIPFYLCDVMRQSLLKENCKPVFYHIDDNFMPEISFSKDNFILYPNYFGICDKNVEILCQKYSKIIIDNSHSFYSSPKGFACFNSVRKFLPVYYGSFLWIQNDDLKIPVDNLEYEYPQTEEELLKRELELNTKNLFLMNEKEPQKIEKYDLFDKRKTIFLNYHNEYGDQNLLQINENNCYSPFCYPFLAKNKENADKLVQELENKGLTIYRYWNTLPKNYNEYKFFERLVPIPLSFKH